MRAVSRSICARTRSMGGRVPDSTRPSALRRCASRCATVASAAEIASRSLSAVT
ncbi:MAG: hypothetical protein R3A52_30500 [Polyangiales bacterium]